MKIAKIFLNNNGRSDEALKHIYTVLISNQNISISIDLQKEQSKNIKMLKLRQESMHEKRENSESKRQYFSSNR